MLPHLRNTLAAVVGSIVMVLLCFALGWLLWWVLGLPPRFWSVAFEPPFFWQCDPPAFGFPRESWCGDGAIVYMVGSLVFGVVAGCASGAVLGKMAHDCRSMVIALWIVMPAGIVAMLEIFSIGVALGLGSFAMLLVADAVAADWPEPLGEPSPGQAGK